MAITFAQAPAWVSKLDGELRKAAQRGLYSAGLRLQSKIVNEVIPQTRPHPPVDRSLYRAGWRLRRLAADAVLVFNATAQAAFIEGGVRKKNVKIGRAMIDALAEWAKRKGLVDKEDPGAARSAAFAIAQSMKKRGIFGPRGLRVLARANAGVGKMLAEEIRREVDHAKK
jgi:site-specific recombinase XerC